MLPCTFLAVSGSLGNGDLFENFTLSVQYWQVRSFKYNDTPVSASEIHVLLL